MNILCLFLAIVTKRDLKYFYFNIKNTFTKSYLKENIFLVLSKGVTIITSKVLKTLRSLYSLKQVEYN